MLMSKQQLVPNAYECAQRLIGIDVVAWELLALQGGLLGLQQKAELQVRYFDFDMLR